MAKAKPQAPPHSDVNPSHYKFTCVTSMGSKVELQVVDVIEAICPNDAHLAHAMTYMLRAGRKSRSSYVEDIAKCAWWCVRAVNFHGGFRDIPKTLKGDG